MLCYRCLNYGHKTQECKLNIVCKYCANNHDSESCPYSNNQQKYKCTNFSNTKKSNHRADDKDNCPVYQQELEKAQKREKDKEKVKGPKDDQDTESKDVAKQTSLETILQSIKEINLKLDKQANHDKQLEDELIKTAVLVKGVVKSLETVEEAENEGNGNITVVMDNLYGSTKK